MSVDPAIAAGHSAEEQQIAQASEGATEAQAQGAMATETAIEATETAEAAAGVALAAGSVAVETADEATAIAGNASVQAEEASQEAQAARTETGELRDEIRGMFSRLEERLFPPEEIADEPADGVEEISLDDSDVGESGSPEPDSASADTTIQGPDGTDGNPGGSRPGGRRFRRGHSR